MCQKLVLNLTPVVLHLSRKCSFPYRPLFHQALLNLLFLGLAFLRLSHSSFTYAYSAPHSVIVDNPKSKEETAEVTRKSCIPG